MSICDTGGVSGCSRFTVGNGGSGGSGIPVGNAGGDFCVGGSGDSSIGDGIQNTKIEKSLSKITRFN